MTKTRLSILLAALTITTGCNSTPYPQYTGTYELVSARSLNGQREENPALLGKFKAPKQLEVLHRMEWSNNYWRHRIGFIAQPETDEEANSTANFELDDLTRKGSGCMSGGGCNFSGVLFREDRKPFSGTVDQVDVWCKFLGYRYTIHAAEISPDPKQMSKIYLDKEYVKVAGGASVPGSRDGKMPVALKDPSKAEIDEAAAVEWLKAAAEKQTITLVISKNRLSDYSGCEDGQFPVSDKDTDLGSIELTYKLMAGGEDLSTDLRSEGASEVRSLDKVGLVEQLVNFK